MSKDPTSVLIGNPSRVRLLRFFLFNPNREVSIDELSRRAKLVRRTARTEIGVLERSGLIRRKKIFELAKDGSRKIRVTGFVLNQKFPLLEVWQDFMFETAPLDSKHLLKKLGKAGKLEFVAISGVLVHNFDQKLDLLLTMKRIDEKRIETVLRSIESEVGMEIRFATMSSADLKHRLDMRDKLTRDLFDYPYQILLDRVNIEQRLNR